jgi:hypothetical protein
MVRALSSPLPTLIEAVHPGGSRDALYLRSLILVLHLLGWSHGPTHTSKWGLPLLREGWLLASTTTKTDVT